ncbi:ROK family transcriptional regulator [Paracoccus suum]|uniref:ROK family transcriptional regulator n=1 Tax=Paracoccus suum TaxID=2259340 RepID=A0A344PKF0_9RHOB|nr:ROK family transcriptional regulator [Paracoccus suum]AXC49855.1 ROK family transcriptional regulator [Paracoccus suum]
MPVRPSNSMRPETMRRHNERLVLTLLRRDGPLARSALAQASGLTPQSMSNIVRDLLARGLIAAEGRVRGRIGQPSVPLSLAPGGAFFLGLQVGRRSARMVLIDFAGAILGQRERRHPQAVPHPDTVLAFATDAAAELTASLPPEAQARVGGLGIAMPFRMWDWGDAFAPWQGRDLRAEAEVATGLPAWLENDASCACAAELIFGRRDLPDDFLHVYIGHYAGGGLVLGGRLWLGPRGNAGAIGSTPVPGGPPALAVPGAAAGAAHAGVTQLLQRASLAALEVRAGRELPQGDPVPDWPLAPAVRARWSAEAGEAIAFAALSAATILDLEAVVIDGAFAPALRTEVVAEVGRALSRLPSAGVVLPEILGGTMGAPARAIGAAGLPLAEGYLLEVISPSPATGG